MSTDASRRFSLTDTMGLVAGTAIGLAFTRDYLISLFEYGVCDKSSILRSILHAILFVVPPAAGWTVVLIFLRLRRPRPPIRVVARQPGTIACAAVVFAFGFRLLEFGLLSLIGLHENAPVMLEMDFRVRPWFVPMTLMTSFPRVAFRSQILRYLIGGPEAGLAVAIAWLTTLATGCWQPEPSWIDRLGRILGIFWMTTILLNWIILTAKL